jgi:hypothetical protein
MAYIVFKNEQGTPKSYESFIAAAKTDEDLLLINKSNPITVQTVDITDAEYDAFLDGSKELRVENESVSFVDPPENTELQTSHAKLQANLDEYKDRLNHAMSKKPTHSQTSKLQEALTFVNSLDASSYTYPTTSLYNRCREAGKWINFQAI